MKASLLGIFSIVFAVVICTPKVYCQQGAPTYSDVNKIFQARCVKCHSGTRPPEGLRLDSYRDALTGSREGPVIVNSDPGKSELVRRIKGISKPRMPKDGPPWLSESEIVLIEKWIAAGAPG